MKAFAILITLFIFSCAHKKNVFKSDELINEVPVFVVSEGLLHPESALYSKAHGFIFVSNVATGNPLEDKQRIGFISKLSTDGKMIQDKWVTGLKAPKGMAVVKDTLYVSDVNEVVAIDMKNAKILQTYKVAGAKFLNDVVADNKGNIYISDMFDDVIYKLGKKGLNVWLKNPKLRNPNGLYTDGKEHLLVTFWGGPIDPKTFLAKEVGAVAAVPLKKSKVDITEEPSLRGHLDGIDVDTKGRLWVSDWISGDVYVMNKRGESQKVMNLGQGTADLSVARELGLLLVPQMYQNKMMAFQLKY